MKKQYTKPIAEILHAEVIILAGSPPDDQSDIKLPLNPDIEDEGYGD